MLGLFVLLLGDVNSSILIGFIIAATLLAVSPGPDNIFVLTQSISNGVKAGLAAVLGLVSGCLVHTSLVAFGVAEIIEKSNTIFIGLKWFGACYLLYLAIKVFKREASIALAGETGSKKELAKLFWKGFLMNVLNPKVAIFFLAFFPGFLFSDAIPTVTQFYVLGFLFMFAALVIFSGIALLAGAISGYLLRYPKTAVSLKWMQILVFTGIAVYLLLSNK